ncbi:DUF4365 domain-containing protein [Streptomyces sp. M54]|uniref:DUF4365 domain-containing protein n=1 Tax=Streptomyces sp. M54 TaxID=2759525 RepID=UPI001FB056EF|nr:DUF4365 domain-containing protein [Streptomyces sp. M54]
MIIVLGQLVLQGVRLTTPSLQGRVSIQLPRFCPPAGPVTWPSGQPLEDDAFPDFAGGKDFHSTEQHIELPPWQPAAELTPSRDAGGMVELDWLLREQPTEDYGIDAHAEVVDGENVRGRLLALQIKGGMSWLRETAPGGWWFRPDAEHVAYWLSRSLPVVVVLHHPETGRCHWQLVSRKTRQQTSTGNWKLLVPEAQALDASARKALREATEGDPYELRRTQRATLELVRPRDAIQRPHGPLPADTENPGPNRDRGSNVTLLT